MVEDGIKNFNKVTENLDDATFKEINKKLEAAYVKIGLRKSLRYTNGGTKESIRGLFSELLQSKRFGIAETITYSTIVSNIKGCVERTNKNGTRLLKNEFFASG